MRILFSSLIILVISCQSNKREKENITETHTLNPWEYINRISDTLPETDFSLNNSREKNREILKKFNQQFLEFKYRIGQNQYIKVQARNIISFPGIGCYMPPFPFLIQLQNEKEIILIELDIKLNHLKFDSLEHLFLRHLIENGKDGRELRSAMFILNCQSTMNQNLIQKIIKYLANAYFKFIMIKYPEFEKSSKIEQNSMLSQIPFTMVYEFFDKPSVPNEK